MTTATPDATEEAELEAVVEALFRGPRERFVADRNAAAQRYKAKGRAEAAARLRALGKPSVSAWAVNQLWWTARAQMEALLDASRDVAGALRTGAGPAAQAAAGQARRRALEGLGSTAAAVLEGGGHAAGMGVLRRISTTLEAVATYAVVGGGAGIVIGCLSEDLDPPGFELVMGLGAAGVVETARAEPVVGSTSAGAASGDLQAAAAVATAERERDVARAGVEQAARVLDEATRVADEAVLAAQHTAQVYREAQARADAARQQAEEAERVALRARAEAQREHERVEEAREALTRRATELERRSEALARARARLGSAAR